MNIIIAIVILIALITTERDLAIGLFLAFAFISVIITLLCFFAST